MNWKRPERKRSWPGLRHYPGICLEELGKTTKTKDTRDPSRDSNRAHTEYKLKLYSLSHLCRCEGVDWVQVAQGPVVGSVNTIINLGVT
jgi:hypothetical protein